MHITCILFRGFVISTIDVAMQLTKLWLKNVTTTSLLTNEGGHKCSFCRVDCAELVCDDEILDVADFCSDETNNLAHRARTAARLAVVVNRLEQRHRQREENDPRQNRETVYPGGHTDTAV